MLEQRQGKVEAYRAKLNVSFKFEGSWTYRVTSPRLRGEVPFTRPAEGSLPRIWTNPTKIGRSGDRRSLHAY